MNKIISSNETNNNYNNENDLDIDLNVDENIILNNNKLIYKKKKINSKKSLDINKKGNTIKEDIKSNNNNYIKIDDIYESYDKDFTILDNKIPQNLINCNNLSENNINNNENKNNNKNNNQMTINLNNYNFQNIINSNIINNSNSKGNNNLDIIKNKEENNSGDNILEDYNISKTFKKNLIKKESDILDFENIELPKESQFGEFTEINCPIILDNNKKEEKQKQINEKNNQNNILFDFYNNRATGIKKSVNNNYLYFFNTNPENDFERQKLYKTCINLRSKKNNINIIKIMAVLKSSNNQTWKDNLKSLVSSLYYNSYGLSKTFDKMSPVLPLYIFNYRVEHIFEEEINRLLKSYLYMSYRSGFVNLNSIGCADYTSDCGWGCMLRCCQMILSKGLIQKKICDFFKKKYSIIDNKCIDNIRRQILCLFNDNYLPSEEIKNHPDFKLFWKKYFELTKTNSEYNSISEIIPPYSIHILCKLGKFAGEYTSDIQIIRLFQQINSQIFNDINIEFFESGYISKKKLVTKFCEEYTDFNSNYLDTITYNGIDYIFKKGGIIFISFRLGLYDLEPSYYDVIPLLFKKFHNNLGFVSGKKNRAYYFIGVQGNNKLIFADPHYNQQITNNSDRDYESYYTDYLYLLDIKDLSAELTLGIGIFSSRQFTQFLDDLKWFKDNLKDLNLISFEKD